MTDPAFLSEIALRDLTGKKQPTAQARVLRRNGLRYFRRADGRLRVPVAQIQGESGEGPVSAPQEPDFAALER